MPAADPAGRPPTRAGPTETSGTPEEQPGWDEHATFIDDLIDVMPGDPFVQNGVLLIEDCADWTVYVDTRIES